MIINKKKNLRNNNNISRSWIYLQRFVRNSIVARDIENRTNKDLIYHMFDFWKFKYEFIGKKRIVNVNFKMINLHLTNYLGKFKKTLY